MENVKTSKITVILGIVGIILGLFSPILGLIPAIIGLVLNLKDKSKYGKAGIVFCILAIIVCIANTAIASVMIMQNMPIQ